MRLPQFQYYAPNSLEKALKIKSELGSMAPVLAGGTDLVVNLKHRLLAPAAIISLKNIEQMKGIETRGHMVVIRAGTSLYEVANNEAIRSYFPLLVTAINSIGAIGIQHFRGTIGGNLCLQPRCIFYNQSQFWRSGKGACHRTGGKDCLALQGAESCQATCSGDTVPVLAALSAQLTIAGPAGTRSIPINEFFTGKGETPFNLAPDEILTEICLPIPWSPLSGSYQRISMRSAVDFPLINAAAAAILENGNIESFRLVVSAAGPAPVLLKEINASFKGKKISHEMMDEARKAAVRAVEGTIIENSLMSKEYRTKMAGVLTARAVKEALRL